MSQPAKAVSVGAQPHDVAACSGVALAAALIEVRQHALMSSAGGPRHDQVPAPLPAMFWVQTVVVALTALGTLGVLSWAGGWWQGYPRALVDVVGTAAFTAWALLPFAAMVAVVFGVGRRWRLGLPATAVGVLVLAVGTAVMLRDFVSSESSTAALLFLVLPVYQLVVVGLVFAGAQMLAWLRGRHRVR